jgi:hypothetical protein
MRFILLLQLILCLTLPLLVGCGSGGPTTHSVSGRITYKDKPVADAQIGFVPSDNTSDVKPARGQTDADGRYTLSTYLGPGDEAGGAMAGTYKVTVTKSLPQDKVVTYEEMQNFKSEVPVHYSQTNTTPLTASVTAGGANAFDFVLEDK